MFPVEPHVNPYKPLPPDDKFMMTDYAPGPSGDSGLLLALVLAFLWVVYCVR